MHLFCMRDFYPIKLASDDKKSVIYFDILDGVIKVESKLFHQENIDETSSFIRFRLFSI